VGYNFFGTLNAYIFNFYKKYFIGVSVKEVLQFLFFKLVRQLLNVLV